MGGRDTTCLCARCLPSRVSNLGLGGESFWDADSLGPLWASLPGLQHPLPFSFRIVAGPATRHFSLSAATVGAHSALCARPSKCFGWIGARAAVIWRQYSPSAARTDTPTSCRHPFLSGCEWRRK